MQKQIPAAQLAAVARTVTTTFDELPREAVPVPSAYDLAPDDADEIIARYDRHGFAVIATPAATVCQEALAGLVAALGLGDPFLPQLYRKGGVTATVSRISAASNTGTSDEKHPSFGSTAGQRLHCDGTLQEIGFIKASLLLCERVAERGGDTILFNSSAALAELVERDPAAATALTAPGVLVRQANINGCADINENPAFTVQHGKLVCGYSVTETDRWATPPGVDESDLRRGVRFLEEAAQPGSRWFRQLRLGPGEAIVFDNTRISHGRTSYVDSAAQRRCLYRGLYLRHPRKLALSGAGDARARGANLS